MRWKPFDFNTSKFHEGETYLFRTEDGTVFADRLVWDTETPANWGDGWNGVEIDDVVEFSEMPLPAPPAATAESLSAQLAAEPGKKSSNNGT